MPASWPVSATMLRMSDEPQAADDALTALRRGRRAALRAVRTDAQQVLMGLKP